jgi:predicted HAD superfamily Cof-like phosphohydrolase
MTDLLRIDVDDGKYTIVQKEGGGTSILRYGEPWMGEDGSFAGVNCVLAMAYELEELRARPQATLEQSDVDEGVSMLREANASFGNYTAAAPAVPELASYDAERLRYYAGLLATIAGAMKQEAAEANGTGRDMLGLLLIRLQLSVEETGEFAEALAEGDLVHAAKELTDMSYVTDGHYLTLGLGDLKLPLYREVHSSNMTKLDPETGKPIINEAGRWVKGPAYREADIASVLEAK